MASSKGVFPKLSMQNNKPHVNTMVQVTERNLHKAEQRSMLIYHISKIPLILMSTPS